MPTHAAANSNPRLRSAALYARGIGALASLAFTLHAGRHNSSILLVVLFAGWVLLPYLGLIAADRLAARARRDIASAIHAATLLLALVPPVIYAAAAILTPGHPATFAFLAVPATSWLAIATLFIATRLQRK
ncbi:MAG TPA: hypothetical protein VG267_08670 [Terracidiphilus sp.]|jgi:hypothetical protein|nr:hypothetical protein [Terracidiphilus sp.]